MVAAVEQSELARAATELAAGIVRSLDVFKVWIPWFGEIKEVEVVGSPG